MAQQTNDVTFKQLSPDAIMPVAATTGSCGWDLCASKTILINPGIVTIVPTDITVQLPPGYYAQIIGRSGNTSRGLQVFTGVIDNDYRGPLGVMIMSHPGQYTSNYIEQGTKIAQLVVMPYLAPTRLNNVIRGEGGFGSTGYHAAGVRVDPRLYGRELLLVDIPDKEDEQTKKAEDDEEESLTR